MKAKSPDSRLNTKIQNHYAEGLPVLEQEISPVLEERNGNQDGQANYPGEVLVESDHHWSVVDSLQ